MPQYVGQVYVGVSFDTAAAGQQLSRSLTTAAGQAGDAVNATLSSRMLQFGTQATRVGRQLSFGISAPLLALGHAADQAFSTFDTSMTKVAALTGTGIAQTNEWSDEVLNLAASYGQTGEDAAAALYLITSSGIKGAEAMRTLDVVGKSAAVGLGDMATIAGLLTSAMNAYGTANLSAAKAADILTGAVQESKVPADQLAGSISQLLPFGSQLGISFDQIVGAMAGLSLQGTNAAMAATQLRGIFNGMLDPSEQAAQALSKIGLSVQQIQDTMRQKGIVAGIRQIRDGIVANGGEADEQLAQIFGNVRALTGVFGLLNNEGGKIDRVFANTTDSANKLNAAFLVTANTEGFKAKQASAELSSEMVKLGQSVTPIKTLFAQTAGAALEIFNSLGPLKNILVIVGAGLAVLGPAAYSIGAIADVLGIFTGAASAAAGAQAAQTAALEANTAALLGETTATEAAVVATETEVVAVEQLEFAFSTASAEVIQLGLFSEATMTSMVAGTEGATVATEGLAAAETEATVAGSALMTVLLPIAAIAVSIGATFLVWKNKLDENRAAAQGLGDVFANNVAGGGIKNAQDEIDKTITQINDLKASADSTWNPIDKQAYADAAVALGEHIVATRADIKVSQELADKTHENADVIFQWLSNQRNAGVVYKDTEAALAGYNAEVAKHGGVLSQAATATGNLADKAKDLAAGFFGVQDATKAFEDSLKKVSDAQKGVTDAEKAATGARRDAADAVRKVGDAQDAQRDSLLKVADAQRALTEARATYQELLKGPTQDEQLDLKQAQLGLRRAQAALRKPSGDPLDRQQGQLDVRRARVALDEARGAHDKNLAKARADVASAERDVVGAQKEAEDSARRVADARLAVVDANDKVVVADQAVKDAHDKVTEATDATVRAASDLNQKQGEFETLIHNSNTQLDPFIAYLEMLKTKYPQVAGAIQPIIDQVKALNDASKPPPAAPPPASPGLPQGEVVEIDGEQYVVVPGMGLQKVPRRRSGGPLAAGQLSTVNEAGVPELWQQGGKQFLLPLTGGKVIPLDAGAVKGGDGISVGDINIYGAEQPVQTAYEVRRQLRVKTRTKGRI